MSRRRRFLSAISITFAALLSIIAVGVLGVSPTPDTVKLNPVGLSIDSSGAWVEDNAAWALFDRDTAATYAPASATSLLVTLPAETDLAYLKVYGSASYTLTVYEDATGSWKKIPGLETIALHTQPELWNTFTPSTTVHSARFKIEISPAGGTAGGIKELEIWGSDHGDPDLTLSGVKSAADARTLLAVTPRPAHIQELAAAPQTIDVPADGNSRTLSFTLGPDPRLIKRAYLVYDSYNADYPISPEKRINNLSWTGGFFPSTSDQPEWKSHLEEINPAWLVRGENKIEFRNQVTTRDPSSYFIRDLKVVAELENNMHLLASVSGTSQNAAHSAEAAYDGNLSTYFELKSTHTLDLKAERTLQPETIKLNLWSASGTPSGTITLQYLQGALWKNFASGGVIDMSTLHSGWNDIPVPAPVATDTLRLTIQATPDRRHQGATVGGINEIELIASPIGARTTHGLVVTYPSNGEYFSRTAYIQGFVDPAANASGTAQISIEGKTLSNPDGAFSISLTKDETRFAAQNDNDPWEAALTATYPDNTKLTQTITLNKNLLSGSPSRVDQSGQNTASAREKYTDKVSPGQAKKIQYKGVTLDIPAGAVDKETEITIIPLTEADLSRLNPGMINVTYPDAGYRFLPHGMKFLKPIKISFGYSKQLFAAGQVDEEVNMYFYNDNLLRWQKLNRTKVDAAQSLVESESDHFTDIINSTLVVPEHPQALSYNPNSIKDIKAADPSANIDLIEPPRASSMGTANLSYPIEIPKGRGAYTLDLNITYSSNNANGWMGLGWDIPLSNIQIDARWGVPKYDGTEIYLLDGAPLADVGGGFYKQRVEGLFRQVRRQGSDPTSYWWEVTDRNGVKYIYGKTATRHSALKNNNPGYPAVISQWFLEQVVDTNGNTTDFFYFDDAIAHQNAGEPSTHIYLDKIYYTGKDGALGKYRVEFVLEAADRPDQVVTGRFGFKTVLRKRLERVDIYFDPNPSLDQPSAGRKPIRRYRMEYRTGDFGKSLLAAIAEKSFDAASEKELYRHEFDYYKGASGFGPVETWHTEKAEALTASEDFSYNWSIFFGIGTLSPPHIGAGGGRGESQSKTRLLFADVNGDGLPDRLFEDWLLDNYNGVELNQHFKGLSEFKKFPAFNDSISTLGDDKTKTVTYTLGLHIPPYASVGGSYSRSFVEGRESLADMNGDGFIDQVKIGAGLEAALNNKGQGFAPSKPWAGNTPADIGLTPEEIAKMKEDFHLTDPVRKWVAPYGGKVRITGTVRKLQAGGLDDVKVEIRKGNTLLWEKDIATDDISLYPIPDILVTGFSAGDALYFRATSIDETSNDAVEFHPVITYEEACYPDAGGTGTTCHTISPDEASRNVTPSAYRQYVYDSSADFVLYNHRTVSWDVPMDGNVALDSVISKIASPEDLSFSILHYRGDTLIPVPGWVDKQSGANDAQSYTDSLVLEDLMTGDKLVFLVDNASKINVAPGRFTWDATITYTRQCWDADPTNPNPHPLTCKDLTQDDLNKVDPDGNPIYIFYPEIHSPARLLKPDRPLLSWVAPLDGTIRAYGDVSKKAVTGSDVFVKIQGVNKQPYQTVLDKNAVDPVDSNGASTPIVSPSVSIPVTAGDRIFFGLHAETPISTDSVTWQPSVSYSSAQYCYLHPDTGQQVCTPATGQFTGGTGSITLQQFCYHAGTATVCEQVTCTASGCTGASGTAVNTGITFPGSPQVNYTFVGIIDDQTEPFSGGFRQWYFGEWNGNKPWDTSNIRVAANSQDTDALNYFMASLPKRKGLSTAPWPLWWSRGDKVYISADKMNPGRLGANITGILHGLGANTLKLSQSNNEAIDASVFGASGGASEGYAKGRQELMDMNGDRFADLVAANTLTLNNGVAGFYTPLGVDFSLDGSSDIRKIYNRNFHFGVTYPPGGIEKNDPKSDGETKKTSNTAAINIGLVYGNSRTDVDFIDINGDGLPDRVAKGGGTFRVRLNLGYRFGEEEQWAVPQWSVGDISPIGAVDISPNVVASNDNIGANLNFLSFNGVRQVVALQDINGDGLPDHVMKRDGENFKVKLNMGDSFGPEIEWTAPGWGHEIGREELQFIYGGNDVLGYSGTYMVSVGLGIEIPICIPIIGICFWIDPSVGASIGYGETELQMADIDGDGYPDHVLKQLTANTNEMFVKRSLVGKSNLLKSVKRPLGGSITLDYKQIGNIVDYSDPNNLIDMPNSQWVLISSILDDGLAGDGVSVYTTTYDYGTPFYSRAEREFFGFNRVIETKNDGSTITKTFENHDYHKKGFQYTEVLRDSQGHVWSKTESTYVLRDLGAPTFQPLFPDQNYPDSQKDQLHVKFPMLTATKNYFYTGTQGDELAFAKSTSQEFTYDTYGNTELFIDRADDGPADDVYATIKYWTDPQGNYIVGKPLEIAVTDQSPSNVYRKRSAKYEQGTGNLLELSSLIQGGKNAVWNMQYDEFGNLSIIQSPAGDPAYNTRNDRFTISYQYDPDMHTYVTGISDSFGYSSAAEYEPRFGQLKWSKDINKNYQVNEYDDFGRLVAVYGPYDTTSPNPPTGIIPTLSFEYTSPAFGSDGVSITAPARAITRNKAVSRLGADPDTLDTVTFVDGMKRIVQTRKEADVNGVYGVTVSGRADYDALGRVVQQFQPVFVAGQDYTYSGSLVMRNPMIFAYDTLDRTIMVKAPDAKAPGGYAVTTTTYDFGTPQGGPGVMFKTTVIDPEGNLVGGANGRGTKISYKDAHDKIVAVVEFNTINGVKGVPITTTYTYDVIDQITHVNDAKNNTTAIEYDLLGRRLSIDNPDTGKTIYTYDANGNMTTKETANLRKGAKKINYQYEYNRLAKIDYPDSVDVAYEYGGPNEAGDNNGNLAGHIKKITNESGVEQRWYGKLGEVVKELRQANAFNNKVANTLYETQYVFDSFGRMLQLTYPDGEILTYTYDDGGLLKQATGVKRQNRYPYIKSLKYDEYGQRTEIVYGNDVKTTYSYDSTTRRLSHLFTVEHSQGRTIQDISYAYDLVGNILNTNNTAPVPEAEEHGGPTEQNFTYDDLYQLKTANGFHIAAHDKRTQYTNNFDYDAISNMTLKVQTHLLIHSPSSATEPKETNYVFNYKYTGPQPHAVTQAGDNLYTYDLNGNMTGRTSTVNGQRRAITWNEENRVKQIDDNGRATVFLYDDTGERVIKKGEHGETVYINRFYSLKNGGQGSKHVFAGETRIVTKLEKDGGSIQSGVPGSIALVRSQGIQNAILQGNGQKKGIYRRLPTADSANPPIEKFMFYYHGDHLGSSSFITDDAGAVYQHLEYFPYGETWVEEGGSSGNNIPGYQFTGKELDPETGLYYYGARYYDPVLSRWISADPAVLSYLPFDPNQQGTRLLMMTDWKLYQLKRKNPEAYWEKVLPGRGGVFNVKNLNVYSYALQNPLAYRDPTGNAAILEWWNKEFNKASIAGKIGLALISPLAYVAHVAVNTVEMTAATLFQPFFWLDYTWGAPNTALGLGAGFLSIMLGGEAKPDWGKSAQVELPTWLSPSASWFGFSLGPTLVGSKGFPLWKHEYGHTWQSRVLGPLYLPVIALPSFASAALNPSQHHLFYTETWADKWSSWP